MKRRELLRHLQEHGCRFQREGSRHFIWGNPANGKFEAVLRHVELGNNLARKICKSLEVPSPFGS